jgi:uncharacterized protein YjhX (UPF0386 family)
MLTNWAKSQMGWGTVRLFRRQKRVLHALANGWSLKSHRYLDGSKVYRLRSLENASEIVEHSVVDSLCRRQLIYSNQKFPTATFSLTSKGRKAVSHSLPDGVT